MSVRAVLPSILPSALALLDGWRGDESDSLRRQKGLLWRSVFDTLGHQRICVVAIDRIGQGSGALKADGFSGLFFGGDLSSLSVSDAAPGDSRENLVGRTADCGEE